MQQLRYLATLQLARLAATQQLFQGMVMTILDPTSNLGQSEFQRMLVARADLAADWLVRSIQANGGLGSSAFYSRFHPRARGWSEPYPETTGYIIPTLMSYAEFSGRQTLKSTALGTADWLCSIQHVDGAFPGGLYKRGHKGEPSIFNTAQIIKGLLAAANEDPSGQYLERASAAAHWLARNVDPEAKNWTVHAYRAGYSPAYYAQVCWPMLAVAMRIEDEEMRDKAILVLETIAGWQLPNGAIKNWGFALEEPAFTHTIAYTLRGFIECADLLNGSGEKYRAVAERAAEPLRRRTEVRGKLAGSYTEGLNGAYWYSCLTGHCQMAIVWSKLYASTGDVRYLNTALKTLQYVLGKQKQHGAMRGGISGSSPIWARYMIFRYPNWATKYLLDAIMRLHADLERVRIGGPCA